MNDRTKADVTNVAPALDRIARSWFDDVEAAFEFVTLMDADHRLLYVNHVQPGVTEYVGLSVFDFVDPQFHDALRQAVRQSRTTGIPQHFDSYAVGREHDRSLYSNWVIALSGALGDGLVAFIATDVTHQDRIEADLERTETTLSSLVENSPDAILITDRDRRILYVNRVEHGIDEKDVIGTPAETFVPASDRDTVLKAFEYVIESGDTMQYETELDAPDGIRRYSTRMVPIRDGGEIDRIMMVATDVTAQREAEKARERLTIELHHAQKMESIGHLTGGVAHDFNNLLIAISGNLELAQLESFSDEERANCIHQALEATRRAGTLTQRLLAFSRKQTLKPQRVDVTRLILEMHDLLRRTLGETINVTVDGSSDLSSTWVDLAQLENAVLNLALNARDAMPDGGDLAIETFECTADELSDPNIRSGRYVVLRVADVGTGMSAEVSAQAVEPFFTTKEVGRGSGLGLSMVYGFVHQSGGHLRIVSEPGKGTVVEMYLPTVEGVSDEPKRLDDAVPTAGDHELILVVEDDELVRSLTARLLEHLGYRTEQAENGEQALNRLAASPDIALVLSDVVLPGAMDGFALAKTCHERYPGVPIVLVSGYPQDTLNEEDLGRWRLLQKPYSTQQLANFVNEAMHEGRTHRPQ
jgi:PAS domain S-box-containing protein